MSRYRPRKTTDYGNSEVEDIIWEVDEDCDGLVDWNNFVLMYCAPATPLLVSYVYLIIVLLPPPARVCNHSSRYYRCRSDKSGCEPKRRFTLAEFMIYDKDGSGTVNEDECMEMM